MYIHRVGGSEPEAPDVLPTRVRPGCRRDGAGDHEHSTGCNAGSSDRPQPPWPGRRGEAAAMTPRLEGNDNRARKHEQGEEEVRHHGDGVEVEQHRDPAERNLRDRSKGSHECDVPDPAGQPHDPPGGEPRDHREDDADERDHAVAELDRRMPALLGKRLVATLRPVVAPEPGRRESHDSSARDDDPEREDGGRRDLDEPVGRYMTPRHGASVLHAVHRSATPEPSRTRPIRWSSRPRPANVAASTAPLSAGSETSRPPAVCGSNARA